jgi:hypothetical protein
MQEKKEEMAGAARALAWTGALSAAVYLATFLFYVRGFRGYTRTARKDE